MKSSGLKSNRTAMRWTSMVVLGMTVMLATTGCTMMKSMVGAGPKRPAPAEFGLGPRTSAGGLYTATLVAAEPIKTRTLMSIRVNVVDASGNTVDEATIMVGGGMPQHGHGLPTRPRVTKQLANGTYEIEGVRFNMGGWWEFRLAITGPAGTDSVTFNLSL
jgi:hypothetical protein